MNKHLEQLIDLSVIDKEIAEYEPKIAEAKAAYTKLIAKQEEANSAMEVLQEEIKAEQLKKQKHDLHLAELSEKLVKNGKRGSDVKNEREAKSLQLEDEIAKEQIDFANEEIERLDAIISNKNEQIAELNDTVMSVNDELKSVQGDVDMQVASIEKDRQIVFDKKTALVGEVNQKALAFYEKIRRWAGESSVVKVKRQACHGCYLKISDKVFFEVVRGEEIITCPHCGRILYYEAEEENDSVA